MKISLGLILFTIISTALVYAETISVNVEGSSFDVDYTATGMTLNSIEADEFGLLLLSVDVADTPAASLEITLDRNFYDSTFEGLDEEFFILVDQTEGEFTETETTSQSRTLRIELPFGTEEIEIIGNTFFGSSIVEETPIVEEIPEETPVVEDKPIVTPPKVEDKPIVTPPKVEDKPIVTPPKVEDKPIATSPKVQCGPGTILKDGACVLDERCGPGTILKDDVCVLDSTPKPSQTSTQGMGKETVVAFIAAFIIAGAIGIILALISKASKSSN
ncbi:MAG: hypothetical protein OEM28_03330 [Nitrosopumilus sp.]|nr:hypothetical protein [Nitrosopumilus sp.]MDH3487427.1 hypothetical protein [Nitrosopumilus sp.]